MIKAQTDRQYYIDWLRVGAMFLLIFFHTACIFRINPWMIKNAVLLLHYLFGHDIMQKDIQAIR